MYFVKRQYNKNKNKKIKIRLNGNFMKLHNNLTPKFIMHLKHGIYTYIAIGSHMVTTLYSYWWPHGNYTIKLLMAML